MSNFLQVADILTHNGAGAFSTSGGQYAKNVDMYGLIGGKLQGLTAKKKAKKSGKKIVRDRTDYLSFDPQTAQEKEALQLFVDAFRENCEMAMRNLFCTRNCRSKGAGKKIRRIMPLCVKWLVDNGHAPLVRDNLSNIVFFGYWKDIIRLSAIDQLRESVKQLICDVILDPEVCVGKYPAFKTVEDIHRQLLFKYLPRKNHNSGKSAGGDKGVPGLAMELFLKLKPHVPEFQNTHIIADKLWRKFVSAHEQNGFVVERLMCANKWDEIARWNESEVNGFGRIPSKAFQKYMHAWKRHLEAQLTQFVGNVTKGEAKGPHAEGLWPHEFHAKLTQHRNTIGEQALELQWQNMPRLLNDPNIRIVVMLDGSCSMNSFNFYSSDASLYTDSTQFCDQLTKSGLSPFIIGAYMAMFIMEQAPSPWKNIIGLFSESARFENVTGTLLNRVGTIRALQRAEGTNYVIAHQTIIERGLRYNIPQDQMPNVVIVISDMEFNQVDKSYKTVHTRIKELYTRAGYEVPLVVYWNVNSYGKNMPVQANEQGTILVSGPSTDALEFITSCKLVTPEEAMLKVLVESGVYDSVVYK